MAVYWDEMTKILSRTPSPTKGKCDVHVIYEDNHLLVLAKPGGLLTVPDMTGAPSLLDWGKNYLKKTRNKPGNVFLGVVHRLDRPVSGLVCFAVTSKAAARLSGQIRDRAFHKTYLALTDRRPPGPSGILDTWIVKDEEKNIVSVLPSLEEGQKGWRATTRWRLLSETGAFFLVELAPETGRPHQLRAHMAALGCPILGDEKYGTGFKVPGGVIALHAWRLAFQHPTKREPMILEAPVPDLPPWRSIIGVEKG